VDWIGQRERSQFVWVATQRHQPAADCNHFHRLRLELQQITATFQHWGITH